MNNTQPTNTTSTPGDTNSNQATVPPQLYTNTEFTVDAKYNKGAYNSFFIYDEDLYKAENLTLTDKKFFDGLHIEIQASSRMDSSISSEHFLDKARFVVIFSSDTNFPHNVFFREDLKNTNDKSLFKYSKGIVYDSEKTPYENIVLPLTPFIADHLYTVKPESLKVVIADEEFRVIHTDSIALGTLDDTAPSPIRNI